MKREKKERKEGGKKERKKGRRRVHLGQGREGREMERDRTRSESDS